MPPSTAAATAASPATVILPWCYAVFGQHSQRRALIESYFSLCVAEADQRPRSVSMERADVIFCNDDEGEVDAALEAAQGRPVVALGSEVVRDGVIPLHRPLSVRSFTWLMEHMLERRENARDQATEVSASLYDAAAADSAFHEKTVLMKPLSSNDAARLLLHNLPGFASTSQPSTQSGDYSTGNPLNGGASTFEATSFGAMDEVASPPAKPYVAPSHALLSSENDFPVTRQGDDPLVALQSQRGTAALSLPLGIMAAHEAGLARYVINTASAAVIIVDVAANLVIEPGVSESRALAAPMDACWISKVDDKVPLELTEAGRVVSFNRLCWQLSQVTGPQPLDMFATDVALHVPRWPNLGGTPIDPPFIRLLNRLSKQPASYDDLLAEASETQVRQALNFLLLMGSLEERGGLFSNLGGRKLGKFGKPGGATLRGDAADSLDELPPVPPGGTSSEKLGFWQRIRRILGW
jgi:hypothetical protein